jgi:mannosyltransferase
VRPSGSTVQAPAVAGATPESHAASFAWLVALITGVGGLLRFAALGTQSFGPDELLTAWHVRGPFSELFSPAPPTELGPHLYFVLVWPWAQVVGDGEVELRLLSALAGTVTVPVVASVARELFGRTVALLTALLVATNPLLVWYSQEARPYALLALLTALALLFFVRALDGLRPVAVVPWAICSGLAMTTHYFAVLWVVAQAGWLLVLERRRRAGGRRLVAMSCAALTLVALALLPLVEYQSDLPGTANFTADPLGTRFGALVKEFLWGPGQPSGNIALVLATFVAGAVIALAAGRYLIEWRRRERRRGLQVAGLTLGAAVVVPVLLAALGADSVTVRYMIAGVIPCALLAAAGAARDGRSRVAVVCVAAIGVLCVVDIASSPEQQRPDFRGVAQRAGPPRDQRAIVASPGQPTGAFAVYWPGARSFLPGFRATTDELVVSAVTLGVNGRPPPVRPLEVPAGFRLVERVQESDYTLLRYRSQRPRVIDRETLARLTLTPFGSTATYVQSRPT